MHSIRMYRLNVKTAKDKCGCVSEIGDRERWVSMCPEHEAEFQAIHQRWAEEHKAHGQNNSQETEGKRQSSGRRRPSSFSWLSPSWFMRLVRRRPSTLNQTKNTCMKPIAEAIVWLAILALIFVCLGDPDILDGLIKRANTSVSC